MNKLPFSIFWFFFLPLFFKLLWRARKCWRKLASRRRGWRVPFHPCSPSCHRQEKAFGRQHGSGWKWRDYSWRSKYRWGSRKPYFSLAVYHTLCQLAAILLSVSGTAHSQYNHACTQAHTHLLLWSVFSACSHSNVCVQPCACMHVSICMCVCVCCVCVNINIYIYIYWVNCTSRWIHP